MQKKLPLINSAHGSETRNIINEIIKAVNDRGLEILSESGFLTWLEKNGIKHREEVATFVDLPSSDSLNTVRGVESDNKIYIKKESGWIPFQTIDISKINNVESQVEDIAINIKSFGAKGDYNRTSKSGTDDTDAIQNAINSMQPGDRLFIPQGDYLITNVIMDLPNDTSIDCLGTLYSNSNNVVLQIGSSTVTRRRYTINGLKLKSVERDWADERVGIQLINLNEAYIDIREVTDFKTNIETIGQNGNGFVHNEIHLGLVMDGYINFHTKESDTGWNNENMTVMGRFAWSSSISNAEKENAIGILEDSGTTHGINNNRYLYPSLEGSGVTTFMKISGQFTRLESPRFEGSGNLLLTSDSGVCYITYGRGLRTMTIIDEGNRNKLMSQERLYWSGGTLTEDEGVAVFKNTSAVGHKILRLENLTGEIAYFTGRGELFLDHSITAPEYKFSTSNRTISYSVGSPENKKEAPPGSIYIDGTNGSRTPLWVKQTGTENTGWKPVNMYPYGNTNSRPSDIPNGFNYFDSSLGKPIWYNNGEWVDSNGTPV